MSVVLQEAKARIVLKELKTTEKSFNLAVKSIRRGAGVQRGRNDSAKPQSRYCDRASRGIGPPSPRGSPRTASAVSSIIRRHQIRPKHWWKGLKAARRRSCSQGDGRLSLAACLRAMFSTRPRRVFASVGVDVLINNAGIIKLRQPRQ